jgi:hypothetical protein
VVVISIGVLPLHGIRGQMAGDIVPFFHP